MIITGHGMIVTMSGDEVATGERRHIHWGHGPFRRFIQDNPKLTLPFHVKHCVDDGLVELLGVAGHG